MALFTLLGFASVMCGEKKWLWICYLCNCLYEKHGKGIIIPITWKDPLEVFEQAKIEGHPFRFVVFIMWLKQQENSYQWYQIIEDKYSQCIPSVISLCLLLL